MRFVQSSQSLNVYVHCKSFFEVCELKKDL